MPSLEVNLHCVKAPEEPSNASSFSTVTLELPGRWFMPSRTQSRETSLKQLRQLGELFVRGAMAVGNLYLRICDHIRAYDIDPAEVSQALSQAGFPESRISEVKRVAYAPQEIYMEYSAGRYGFRVALEKSRLYYAAHRTKPQAKRRQLRKAAGRLIKLASVMHSGPDGWEYELNGYKLVIRPTEGFSA